MTDTVVRVRDCACPGTPHTEPVKYAGSDKLLDGDVVFLKPTLPLEGGLAAQADIISAAGVGAELTARWRVSFVRYGATGWNLVDEDGDAVPFDVNVLLDDYGLSHEVAERCDDLYGDAVMRPLLARLKTLSKAGPTKPSTSPANGSTPKQRGRLSPVPTAGTKQSAA